MTRVDPFLIFLSLAFALWMRRRPDFFARFFSLRWLRGFLIGEPLEQEHLQRTPRRG